MRAILLTSENVETCHPLTLSRTVAELPVGNCPLAERQGENLQESGFELVDSSMKSAPSPALFVRGDVYVSRADCTILAAYNGPVVLEDKVGQPLAWIGVKAEVPSGALRVTARQGFRIAYPWDLLYLNEVIVGELNEDVIQGEVDAAAHIEGHLRVGQGTRLLPGVFIEGNVMIGRNCKIGPNCYLRGPVSIGHNCHVGQAVELKNTILMHGVSVGHLSYCGDTIIADNANLGAGTITANLRHDNADQRSMVQGELVDTGRRKLGAVIGEGVHTGIHTSIYPGRKIWPGAVTRPGEIVRKDILS